MSYEIQEDWQQQSPAWRDLQIHKCLCTMKGLLEDAELTDIYTLTIQSAQINLANATTYYFGGFAGSQPTTVAALVPVTAPKAGVLTNVHLIVWVNGTLATAGNCTLSIRVNNTTDYLVTNTLALTAVTNKVNVDTLTIPIAEDDEIEFKLLTPTWATPPTQVRIFGNIVIAR